MAETYKPEKPTAYISIYTPNDKPAKIDMSNANVKDVIWLCFDDLTKDVEFTQPGRVCQLITNNDAMLIKRFVEKNILFNITEFVVHCDAGISRSPGVSCALEYCINDNNEIPYAHNLFNRLVYKRVVEAFKGPMCGGHGELRKKTSA
jgi:predicted protein tyrosine phosphatase